MPSPDVTELIERAIEDHLVLRVTYQATDGSVLVLEIEPAAIRFNRSAHRVLWCRNRAAGHVEELLLDGIRDAVATGEVFVPQPWEEA